MNTALTVKHFNRYSSSNKLSKDINTNKSIITGLRKDISNNDINNNIPIITGLRNDISYNFFIEGINYPIKYDNSGNILDASNNLLGNDAKIYFTFNINSSFRTDFPNYNNGDKCDPSFQGNDNNFAYLLLDFYASDTNIIFSRIMIEPDTRIFPDPEIKENAKNIYNPNRTYRYNFLGNRRNLFNILRGLKSGEKINNISIVITPYDNNDYSGFPLIIMFDKYANSIILNQTNIDFIQTHIPLYQNITGDSISTIDFKIGSAYTEFYAIPDYKKRDTNDLRLIDISGFCNNNDYGVSFIVNTTNVNNPNKISTYKFGLFPYSNVAGLHSDFPLCIRDASNNSLITMYSNKNSVRILSGVNKKITPTSKPKSYFKIANLRNQEFPRINNISLDTFIKLNPSFFQSNVVIPQSTISSIKKKRIQLIRKTKK